MTRYFNRERAKKIYKKNMKTLAVFFTVPENICCENGKRLRMRAGAEGKYEVEEYGKM